MPIHRDTYAMQNAIMHKRKAIHILHKELPPPTQETKHTSSSLRKQVKVAWSRGLVKISASWFCVGTWIKVISPFSTLSLRKWYLTSICLVLEWIVEFFATLMAVVLSHRSRTWVYSSPKSLMVYVIQRRWEQQLAVATYSTLVVDWATLYCLREDQDTKEEPNESLCGSRTCGRSLPDVVSGWQRGVDWFLAKYSRCRLRIDWCWCRWRISAKGSCRWGL
jgi:hypothetical protein